MESVPSADRAMRERTSPFRSGADIVAALRRVRDCFDPTSCSVLLVPPRRPDPTIEPFRPGFLAALEERAELARLMREIEPRSRTLLLLWFVESRPVTAITRILGISRIHCYRLKSKALERMLAICRQDEREEAAS